MTSLRIAISGWSRHLPQMDRVVLAILALFGALAIAAPEQALASLRFTLDALASVAPFLLLSVLVAAYAKASGADSLIARAFRGHVLGMIGLAAVTGTLSPFCSCGVIPLIAALLAMGVPLAPVMAFWLSSPLMDPGMFILTVGTLGTAFALGKTAAAIAIGVLGGLGVWAIQRMGGLSSPLREGVGNGGCAGARVRSPAAVVWRFWDEPARRQAFAAESRRSLYFLGKWLALAFVLESLMVSYVPAEWVVQWVGGTSWSSVIVAALVGMPAYLNGYAALPLVAGLVDQGMSAGAGMAFLLAGGVSSIPAAIAVFALARLPVFVTYLGFALVGAVSAGLVYGWVS